MSELKPDELCDLIYWWARENRSDEDWSVTRAKFELPPIGYEGSLVGTEWDDSAILAGYEQAEAKMGGGR